MKCPTSVSYLQYSNTDHIFGVFPTITATEWFSWHWKECTGSRMVLEYLVKSRKKVVIVIFLIMSHVWQHVPSFLLFFFCLAHPDILYGRLSSFPMLAWPSPQHILFCPSMQYVGTHLFWSSFSWYISDLSTFLYMCYFSLLFICTIRLQSYPCDLWDHSSVM